MALASALKNLTTLSGLELANSRVDATIVEEVGQSLSGIQPEA